MEIERRLVIIGMQVIEHRLVHQEGLLHLQDHRILIEHRQEHGLRLHQLQRVNQEELLQGLRLHQLQHVNQTGLHPAHHLLIFRVHHLHLVLRLIAAEAGAVVVLAEAVSVEAVAVAAECVVAAAEDNKLFFRFDK